jgi:outer membrane protein assembly factor BamB
VLALDRQTGDERFTSQRGDFKTFATNAGKDGVVYAATAAGTVYAIDAVTQSGQIGEVVWAPASAAADAAVARAD